MRSRLCAAATPSSPPGSPERPPDVLLVGPEVEHPDGEQRADLGLAEEAAAHLVELGVFESREAGQPLCGHVSIFGEEVGRAARSRRASTPISMNAPGLLRMYGSPSRHGVVRLAAAR